MLRPAGRGGVRSDVDQGASGAARRAPEGGRVAARRWRGGAVAGARGPAAQCEGDALCGGGARAGLAPAGGRGLAGAALRPGPLALGLFEALLRQVAGLRRRAAGRKPEPRLAVIDTQSVACIPVRGPRGYDAAKKVLGRKRVALVDADGAWLAVAVVPANVQDRDCLDALTPGKQAWPSLREAVLDGAFIAERCEVWCNFHGMRRRVVERDPAQKGFVVLERRWVVERSFGWLVHWGGLLRDRAGRLDVSTARVALAAVLSGVEALINPMPIQDAAS